MEHVQNRPNIVFILADDMGAWALGAQGNEEIQTPNLDRLAAEGVRFENFFCSSPVCSPARASIMTGRIPSQHGVHDWIRSGNLDKEKLDESVAADSVFRDEEKAVGYLDGQTCYTELLEQAGYACALSGKWHLGNSIVPQKGFSRWYSIARGGCSYMRPDVVEDGKVKIENGYITEFITEHALTFLDDLAQETNPFYLGVHYTAPHSPWERSEHPEEYVSMYDDCPFESVPKLPIHPNQIATCPRGEGEHRKELLRGYYASITAMDHGIRQIIDSLEEKGMRDNTLVIFMSDNGMNMGHHGVWGKGNGTFPLNMYDTSVKVPAIFSHPGVIAHGQVCDELLSQYDVFPTILEYVGLNQPEQEIMLPGTSFAELLSGKQGTGREDVVIYDEYGPVRMIRTREWKYVHNYPYGPHALYHVLNDPDENTNRIDDPSCMPVLESLRLGLGQWFGKYVIPDKDGVSAPVCGSGQIKPVSPGVRESSFTGLYS